MKSNSLGPIAETYSELQSLNLLFEANRSPPIPEKASEQEALRACWQSIEIALINLELLFIRLGSTAKDQYVNELGVVGPWLVGLGKIVMNLLSTSLIIASGKKGNLICLYDSPNLIKLIEAQHNFAILVSNSNQLDSVTSSGNETYFLSYIHLFREVMKHGAIYVNWDSYDSFTSPNDIREAVLELELNKPTFFSQFRAAHQIPELLISTVNSHLDSIFKDFQISQTFSYSKLLRVDALLAPVITTTSLLDEILSADDYHIIRENLGKTSGSHSTEINNILFRSHWPKLFNLTSNQLGDLTLQMITRSIGIKIDQWKITHLNLPRQKLGGVGNRVKSLTGTKDALATVEQMRKTSEKSGPTYFEITRDEKFEGPLFDLENYLLKRLAETTKKRFPDVQNRTGYFSEYN